MKPFYKVLFLLLLGNAILFISQACRDKCKGGTGYFKTYSIPGKVVTIVGIDSTEDKYYNNYRFKDYEGLQTRYDSVGFHFKSWTSMAKHFEGGGHTSAYACSPVIDGERIFSLKITSNQNYNSAFPAGRDLSQLMTASDGLNVRARSVGEAMNSARPDGNSFLLKFMAGPDENLSHDLTFTFELSRGKILVSKIMNVLIKK